MIILPGHPWKPWVPRPGSHANTVRNPVNRPAVWCLFLFSPADCPLNVTDRPSFLNSLATGYAACECASPQDGLLLAVSGGADSMSLLHGTAQLWPDNRDRIVVAHVDHQLRGAEGRADANFVEQAAQSLGLPFVLLTCDVPAEQAVSGGGIEEVARRNRYQLLQDAALVNEMSYVVCAHHRDDQAETVLHNILRGTGLKGLAGISSSRSLCDAVQLIRPLLGISKTAIEAFLRRQQLSWQTDASNASEEFTRNRIRKHLLPLLADGYNPQVAGSLLRLAQHAREADTLADQVAQCCLNDVVLELQPGVCRLDRTRLAAWPESAVRSALRLIWEQQSWPQQSMTQAHWDNLASAVTNTESVPSHLPGVEISATESMVRLFKA